MAFEYEDVVLYWINRLSFLARKQLQQKFAENGEKLGAEEWAVLMLLWKKDGRLPSELADSTIRDRTTMTRLVDGMCKKQLVVRRSDPEDGRRVVVYLTERGRKSKIELIPIARELIANSTANIDENDLDVAMQVLRKMAANLLDTDIEDRQ